MILYVDWWRERDQPFVGEPEEPSSCHASCLDPVTAFPAFSLHSRASDVVCVSVCRLSQAKSTSLDSHCSSMWRSTRGPHFSGEDVTPTPPAFSSLFILTSWVFNTPLPPSGPTSLSPLKRLALIPTAAHLPPGISSPGGQHVAQPCSSPSPRHFEGGPSFPPPPPPLQLASQGWSYLQS